MKRAPKPKLAEILAALPAAMWLYDQVDGDTRARRFIPVATTPTDLALTARDVAKACASLARRTR